MCTNMKELQTISERIYELEQKKVVLCQDLVQVKMRKFSPF